MEKYKMKYISLILLTVFLSSPCFSEEWVIKVKHLGWGANAQVKGLTLPLEEINELVTASGKIEIHPMSAQREDSWDTITTAAGGAFFYPDYLKAKKVTGEEDTPHLEWQFVLSGDYNEKGKFITQVKPVIKLHQAEQEGRKLIIKRMEEWGNSDIVYHSGFAEMPFGAKDYLPEKELIKSGPNGGGGAGAYQAQFFLWEQGSVSEEQMQRIAEAMGAEIEVVPLYSGKGFNSADIVQYNKKRILSEDAIEFIKGTIENPTLEDSVAYKLQEQLEAAETFVSVVNAFSNYSLLENEEDTEKRMAYIEGLGSSSFGLDTWSGYGKADAVKGYGISGFSSGIEDYSSMKGLMLIGPNGGGGAGAYMIRQ